MFSIEAREPPICRVGAASQVETGASPVRSWRFSRVHRARLNFLNIRAAVPLFVTPASNRAHLAAGMAFGGSMNARVEPGMTMRFEPEVCLKFRDGPAVPEPGTVLPTKLRPSRPGLTAR